MSFTARLLRLGSGELGKEFAISAKRLGLFDKPMTRPWRRMAVALATEAAKVRLVYG